MTARLAILGHILYWIGCIVAAGLVAIMIMEAIALFEGRVTNFERFFDLFRPSGSADFPTMPQAFALAIAAWLFALVCRRCLVGEKDRELYLTAKEVDESHWDSPHGLG